VNREELHFEEMMKRIREEFGRMMDKVGEGFTESREG